MKKFIFTSLIVCFILIIIFYFMKENKKEAELIVLDSGDEFYNVTSGKEESYIYFGRPSCPDCNDFFPILKEAMKEYSQDVYYYNTDDRLEDKDYEEIIEIFKLVWIPALYEVKDNAITDVFPLQFERNPSDEEILNCKEELKLFFKK